MFVMGWGVVQLLKGCLVTAGTGDCAHASGSLRISQTKFLNYISIKLYSCLHCAVTVCFSRILGLLGSAIIREDCS